MEFPAVSHTRIDFWKEQQYTQSGMWWFTLFFGFFGLHHLLLRSPQTAVIFFFANIFLLGYPWFYDLIQLSKSQSSGLNPYGLGHPWGALGLAQGMWVETQGANKEPNPWWFLLYTLLIPIGVLANLVAGDSYNTVGRFLLLTIIPLGFFLTMCAFFYDVTLLLVNPADIFLMGSKRFFPFTFLGMDYDGHSPNLMTKAFPDLFKKKDCVKESMFTGLGNFLLSIIRFVLTILGFVSPALQIPIRTAASTADTAAAAVGTVANSVISVAEHGAQSAIQTAKLGTEAVIDVGQKFRSIGQMIPQAASLGAMRPIGQVGGAKESEFTPLDYFAGGSILALVIGGILLRTF